MPEGEDPILNAIEYLRAVDHEEDVERAHTAADLERIREQVLDTLAAANGALRNAAEFAGRMAEVDADPEAVNAPFNEGGSGYIAHTKIWSLQSKLGARR